MLADVLHHTTDPMVLLREAARVARRSLIIKDHRTSRIGAAVTLRFMDWVGNRPHHVPLTYNYWPEKGGGKMNGLDNLPMSRQILEGGGARSPSIPGEPPWILEPPASRILRI
jgi:hypothetical protein